jgi:secreted trypsin-like serine protease
VRARPRLAGLSVRLPAAVLALLLAGCVPDRAPEPPSVVRTPIRPTATRVVFGRPRLSGHGGQRRAVTTVAVHPRHRPEGPGSVYDVAVLTLDRPVTSITPVRVAVAADRLSSTGQVVTFTGWGDASVRRAGHEDEAQLRDRMRAGHVTLMHRSVCRTVYAQLLRRGGTAELVLCMKTEEGVGHCKGDSGGPVVAWRGDEPVQVGVVSFGAGCGDRDFPAVAIKLDAAPIGGFVRAALGG